MFLECWICLKTTTLASLVAMGYLPEVDTGLFEEDGEDEVCNEEEGSLDSPKSHLGLQGGSVDHILGKSTISYEIWKPKTLVFRRYHSKHTGDNETTNIPSTYPGP